MTDQRLTGHCLCGKVSFVATGDPVSTVNCHCTDCRRTTGAAYGTVLYFPAGAVAISGVLSVYGHHTDRGTNVARKFCPTCGSQMFSRASAWPDLIGIRAGCIEQTNRIAPQRNVFVSSMIPSTALDPRLPKIPRMP